jgi:isoamylase
VDIAWHGTQLFSPGFTDPNGRALAFTIAGFQGDADLHVMMNMFWEPLDFEVPVDPRRAWRVAVDTFATATPGGSYTDIFDPGHEPAFTGRTCTVNPRSIVVLVSELA